MSRRHTPIAALILLIWACPASAQDPVNATNLQRETLAARAATSAAAEMLRNDLAALVPSVPGWTCRERDRSEDAVARGIDVIPLVWLACEHHEQSLDLTLVLDPTGAAVICKVIDFTRAGTANGKVKPGLFRFFDGKAWRIMRNAVDLEGCAAGGIALKASGDRSEEAIALGQTAIDVFAEAMLGSDTTALLGAAEASGHAAALNRLMGLLHAQSRQLAELIPSPPGAARKVTLHSMEGLPEELRPTVLMLVGMAPGASANLEVGACRIHVGLSAGPITLHEAMNTGRRWARRVGEDGTGLHAYIRRNTERVVGQERVDGTGIEALVDDRVIVQVLIPGAHPCESDPGIVRRLFEEILATDLSAYGAP